MVLKKYNDPELINSLAGHMETAAGQDAFIWMEEMGLDQLENPCNTAVLKEEHIQKYRVMEKMLTNQLYERMDLVGACARLQIRNLDKPRMTGLAFAVYLNLWKVTGIDRMYAFSRHGLGGGLLADCIGTGKSLVMRGLITDPGWYQPT